MAPWKLRPANFQINLRATIQNPIADRWLRVGNWEVALKPIWELGIGNFAGPPGANLGDEDERINVQLKELNRQNKAAYGL
jgi:hypothetical protein